MTRRFLDEVERMQADAYGGVIPPRFLEIAQLQELGLRRRVFELVRDRGVAYELSALVMDAILESMAAAVHLSQADEEVSEQLHAGGFGSVSDLAYRRLE